MSNSRNRLKNDDEHSKCSDETVYQKKIAPKTILKALNSQSIVIIDSPNEGVSKAFKNDEPTDVTMEEIESVERNPEEGYEGIVSS